MRVAWLFVIIASGCYMQSPVMTFGAGKSAKEAQIDHANKLTPPTLVALDEGWPGQVSVAKIRVYADDDFRAQNVRWRDTFAEQLAYANEVLGPLLGVRLEAEYREWHHRLVGAKLDDQLNALRQFDPGTDVLAVVGLTSALSLVSATFEHLGMASSPGRHMMLRGYAFGYEKVVFERAFKELRPEDRDALYQARRRHKSTAIFLHELGHNLGVMHEDLPDTIMNATYSERSASFTPEARDTMLATIDQRLGRARPKPTRPAPKEVHPTLVIRVDAAGDPSIGGNTIDEPTLDELLRMSFADDRDTQIVVKAARATPKAAVVKILERAKAAGLRRLAIASDDAP